MLIARHKRADQFRRANNWVTTLVLERLDKRRDDTLDGLLDDMRRVLVVLAKGVGAHEGEDGHDTVFDDIRSDIGEGSEKEECTILDLWRCGGTDSVDEDVGADAGVEIYRFGVLVAVSCVQCQL